MAFALVAKTSGEAGALLVVAGPGSGKTRVLTERVRRLLDDPSQHFRVLALTFTNKAANEIKDRLNDVPDIVKRAFVGTLHSFCMEVLANRGKPIGVDGLPNIFEAFEDRRQVLANAVHAEPRLFAALREAGKPKEQQRRYPREVVADHCRSTHSCEERLELPQTQMDGHLDGKNDMPVQWANPTTCAQFLPSKLPSIRCPKDSKQPFLCHPCLFKCLKFQSNGTFDPHYPPQIPSQS